MAGRLKAEHEQLLAKAHQALGSARTLLKSGDSEGAISRAYYAMFHATRAFLVKRGIFRHKHSAVIAAFGQAAVKTGLVPDEIHRLLIRGFEDRNAADYDPAWEGTPIDSQEAIQGAARFLRHVKRLCR
jgi:uncharacterized protein (UPF0332 family)